MHKPTHFQCPPVIIEKITQLTYTLQQEQSYLKAIAADISHRQLRNSIYLAAQECNQFATEMNAQMAMLGHAPEVEHTGANLEPMVLAVSSSETIKMAVDYCRETELRLIAAYREILNEPYLMSDLRVLLRQQYNSVLCAFLQLKLLDGNYIYCSDDYLGE